MDKKKFEIAAKIGKSLMFFAENFGGLCLKLDAPVTDHGDHERLKQASKDLGMYIYGFGNFDVQIKKISFESKHEAEEFAERWKAKGIFDEIGIFEIIEAWDDKNYFESKN